MVEADTIDELNLYQNNTSNHADIQESINSFKPYLLILNLLSTTHLDLATFPIPLGHIPAETVKNTN